MALGERVGHMRLRSRDNQSRDNQSSVPQSDLDVLNFARHGVSYGGRTNSLVEWTLSEAWTYVDLFTGIGPRGHAEFSTRHVNADNFSGEISV